jgi:hypothetical protein
MTSSSKWNERLPWIKTLHNQTVFKFGADR